MTGTEANLYTYVNDNPLGFSDPLGLAETGPPHTPKGLGFTCYPGDPCPLLIAKMATFSAMIDAHKAFDVLTNQRGRHAKEIGDFYRGLRNCKDIFDKECKCEVPRPLTQQEQQQLRDLIAFVGTITLTVVAVLAF